MNILVREKKHAVISAVGGIGFLPARRYAVVRYLLSSRVRPSVRPSVSHKPKYCIVSKRLNQGSPKQGRTIAQGL